MKKLFIIGGFILTLFMPGSAVLAQIKNCEELKTEIAAKLDAKGVKNYSLDIVPAESVKDQTVVGSCEGGKKRIVYKRG